MNLRLVLWGIPGVAVSWHAAQQLPAIGNRRPAEALDRTLAEITARYGARTADVVAMQLEYPRPNAAAAPKEREQ